MGITYIKNRYRTDMASVSIEYIIVNIIEFVGTQAKNIIIFIVSVEHLDPSKLYLFKRNRLSIIRYHLEALIAILFIS